MSSQATSFRFLSLVAARFIWVWSFLFIAVCCQGEQAKTPNAAPVKPIANFTDVAEKAGLTLNVNRVPADGYWSNHWMKHPLGFGNINPRPSADILLTLFFKSDAAWNECGWKNEKFDQLLAAARAETDEAKRKQMYWDMQAMVHQSSGIGIPIFLSLIDGLSTKVKGLGSIPLGGLMGYNFAENVWLEA